MYCFIYLTYSYLFSPSISFVFWMGHLILSKNQLIILKPMSHADSSFGFPVHKCARPSFLENLFKLPSSTFPAFPVPKASLASPTLSPCEYLCLYTTSECLHTVTKRMSCLWRATVGKDPAFQLTLEAAASDAETKNKEKIEAETKLQQPNTELWQN